MTSFFLPLVPSGRRPATAALLAAVLVALPLVSGCAALRSGVAVAGRRPGVDVPSQPVGLSPQPLGRPPGTTGGEGGYAFMATHRDGTPVAFDPCRQVHVVVNPALEPPGGRELLLGALGALSTATGLRFVLDGETDEAIRPDRAAYQPERYGDRWAPVLVTWEHSTSPMLGERVLGRAGPIPFTGRDADSTRLVSGLAVFNADGVGAKMRLGRDEDARAVLLHELGHLVGLAHVGDPYQVMFDTNSYPLPSYRAGDRRGLQLLGMGRCYDDY